MSQRVGVRPRIIFLICMLTSQAGIAQDTTPSVPPCIAQASKESLANSVLHPFWEMNTMRGETALFQREAESKLPTARLLMLPTRILKVTSADGKVLFKEGSDYRWLHNTNVLELPSGSRIPSRTWEQMHPALTPTTAIGEAAGGKTSLLFDRPGDLFQNLQVAVTYEHQQAWTGYIPHPAHDSLSHTYALLQARQPLKLVVLGDSISYGSGSSSDYRKPPCQPPYTELVNDGLQQRYGSPITFRNLSVGGKTAAWGAQMASHVADEKPDLVILAFGMNDASGRRSVAAYSSDLRKMIDTIQASSPDADFILVATMSGNPEWSHSNPELYLEYREALQKLVVPGIVLADMTSLSQSLLQVKTFADITANGVNHPNDFGHRLYAQLILELLR